MTEYGWAGTILRVNLTTREIIKQPFPEEWQDKFLGGRNVNSKILFDEVPSGIDPLGPQNLLIIGTGPVTGVLTGHRQIHGYRQISAHRDTWRCKLRRRFRSGTQICRL